MKKGIGPLQSSFESVLALKVFYFSKKLVSLKLTEL